MIIHGHALNFISFPPLDRSFIMQSVTRSFTPVVPSATVCKFLLHLHERKRSGEKLSDIALDYGVRRSSVDDWLRGRCRPIGSVLLLHELRYGSKAIEFAPGLPYAKAKAKTVSPPKAKTTKRS